MPRHTRLYDSTVRVATHFPEGQFRSQMTCP